MDTREKYSDEKWITESFWLEMRKDKDLEAGPGPLGSVLRYIGEFAFRRDT